MNTVIFPGSGKRRPYVQHGGGEVCIILHLSACTGANTSMGEHEVLSPNYMELGCW